GRSAVAAPAHVVAFLEVVARHPLRLPFVPFVAAPPAAVPASTPSDRFRCCPARLAVGAHITANITANITATDHRHTSRPHITAHPGATALGGPESPDREATSPVRALANRLT